MDSLGVFLELRGAELKGEGRVTAPAFSFCLSWIFSGLPAGVATGVDAEPAVCFPRVLAEIIVDVPFLLLSVLASSR